MMSAATINAERKMTVAETSKAATSGLAIAPPMRPPLSGRNNPTSPSAERRKTKILTLSIRPNLFSKLRKSATARSIRESGKSMYPTPSSCVRIEKRIEPTAPPISKAASARKIASAIAITAATPRSASTLIGNVRSSGTSAFFRFPFLADFSRSFRTMTGQ